jgi:predicted nucleic acid-binding protein
VTRPIIVDASVAIKWAIDEPSHRAARDLIALTEQLTAPDIIHAEVANVCRKKVRRGELDRAQGALVLATMQQIIPAFEPAATHAERAFAMALDLDHHAYDCFYLAQAEAVRGVVVTADRRLWRKVDASSLDIEIRTLDQADLVASLITDL